MRTVRITQFIAIALVMALHSGAAYSQNARPDNTSLAETPQPELSPPPLLEHSLESYLKYAASQNPALKAAFYDWKAKLQRISIVKALPDPQISYSYLLQSVETRVGPQEFKLGLRQMIPWFGTLGAQGDVAGHEAKAAFYRLESLRQGLLYEVKKAYIDYYLWSRQTSIASDNMELLKTLESSLTARYETSLAANSDLVKLQVEMGRLEDRLATLAEKRRTLESELRQLLNAPDSVHLPIPQSIADSLLELDLAEIRRQALTNNPSLETLRQLTEREKASLNLAGKASRPEFMLGLNMIGTGRSENPMSADDGKDAWEVSIGVNLPLWFGKNKARRAEARANLRGSEYRLQSARNELMVYVDKVLFEYNDAARKIRLYRDGLIPRAEQSFSTAYAAYQAGDGDFLDLIDAQRLMLEFQLGYEDALSTHAVKYAEIQMIIASQGA